MVALLAPLAPGIVAVVVGNALGRFDPHFFFLAGLVIGLEAAAAGGLLVTLYALRVLAPSTFFRVRPNATRNPPLAVKALLPVVALSGLLLAAIGAWVGGLSLVDALLPLDSEKVNVVRTEVGYRGAASRYLVTTDGMRLEAPLLAAVFETVPPGDITVWVGHVSRYVVRVAR